jgi:hypothetical protein
VASNIVKAPEKRRSEWTKAPAAQKQEATMVRRSWIRAECDQRVVKWALVAATVAFALGSFAETKLERGVQEAATQEVVQDTQAGATNTAG